MGRIAELYEKKALGTLTKGEAKELEKLLAEADMARKDAEGAAGDDDADEDEDEDEEEDAKAEEKAIDKMAQKLADAAQKRMESSLKKITDDLRKKGSAGGNEHAGNSAGFIIDKRLGKAEDNFKVTVEQLSEMKEAVPGREKKTVKEVSARTKLFLTALMTSDREKLQLLSEGTNANGGYLVPAEFANMIVEDIRDINIMRQYAAPPIPTQSDTLHLPGLTSRPYAQWRAEAVTKSTTTASFKDNVFTPFSLAAIVGLSNELVADATLGVGASIVSYIANLISVALNEKEEQAFWVGSGSGQPTGVHGNTGRTFDAGAGASDAQRADNLIKAYANTPQGYRNKGVFVANMGTIFEMRRLKDLYGRYLLTDGGGLSQAAPLTVQGRPLYESNYLAGGEVIFGDLDYYQIVDREGISVRVSDEATVAGSSAFEKNLTYVRVEKRVDAKVTLPAAFTTLLNMGTP
jgi:HK97 family phage major capsid protein